MAVGNLEDVPAQLTLPFDDRSDALDAVLDEVRERYGPTAVVRARLLGRASGFTVPILPD